MKSNNMLFALLIIMIVSISSVYSQERNDKLVILQIDFPLEGVYITPNTPGTKVPSHGTEGFGEEYAIDFVKINENDRLKTPYKKTVIEYLFKGLQLSDFYGWGQKIYSPMDGEVIAIENDIKERNPVNIFHDYKNTIQVTKKYLKYRKNPTIITGNYVLIKHSDTVYVLLAHLKYNSITVKKGQTIQEHEEIGELGHSGNSTMPHLHMQLMDNQDYSIAKGIPFVFKKYEIKSGKKWILVTNSVPKKEDVIRNTTD